MHVAKIQLIMESGKKNGKKVKYLTFGSYKMKLNRELCALRRELSQLSWLDDSFGCCMPIWYCPF